MTPRQAQSIGRKKAIIPTVIVLSIFLIIFMAHETGGDFANGILFFLQAVLSIQAIGFYATLFCFTFLFAGMAGKAIIIRKRNFITNSVTYALLITVALFVYNVLILKTSDQTADNKLGNSLLSHCYFVLSNTWIYFTPLPAIWLWAGYRMKLAAMK